MASANDTPDQILSVRGLKKSFGSRVAVDGIGFAIAAGEVYGLLGPNGAGKTTSISMIAGILARDAGEITVDGINTTLVRLRARSLESCLRQLPSISTSLRGRISTSGAECMISLVRCYAKLATAPSPLWDLLRAPMTL